MPNAPAISRPDVKAIAARYNKLQFYNEQDTYGELALLVADIPALIAHIEALEAVIQERDDTDQKVWKEAQEAVDELNRREAFAALGDGDG